MAIKKAAQRKVIWSGLLMNINSFLLNKGKEREKLKSSTTTSHPQVQSAMIKELNAMYGVSIKLCFLRRFQTFYEKNNI